MLVELVMGQQMVLDVKVAEQIARCARVFGKHYIGLFQYAYGAERHVLHIAHWCRYNI